MEKSDRRQHINEQKKHKKFHPQKNKQTVADTDKSKKPQTTSKGNTINFSSKQLIPNKNTSDNADENENVNSVDAGNSQHQQQKQFSKRGVQSNWQKYDETSDDQEENEQNLAADFQSLLIAPQSVGSYFVFNTEKDWEILSGGDDNVQTAENSNQIGSGGSDYNPNQYFQLNLIQLAESLQSIPFYERQNLSTELFTNEEQRVMIKEANCFKQKIIKNNSNKFNRMSKPIDETTLAINESLIINDNPTKSNDDSVDDELDALLSFNVKPQIKEKGGIKVASSSSAPIKLPESSNMVIKQQQTKQELQQWLDDILDE